ncbi:MAG: phage major tail tube protein [Desulfovibrio sp.]|nr:phage major tail tube protein [Desulfovibrio sp.]
MANTNPIQEKLVNFRVYNDANDLLGIATVDLPELSAMTDTVSGAGIAGEVDSPVLGHFQAMSLTLHWRTVEAVAMTLAEQRAHHLEIRGSQQQYDAGSGNYTTVPVRIVCKGVPKTTSLGSFEPGSGTDSSSEFELNYIKIVVAGKERLEIDKYNYICRIGGADFLKSVRADLGLS